MYRSRLTEIFGTIFQKARLHFSLKIIEIKDPLNPSGTFFTFDSKFVVESFLLLIYLIFLTKFSTIFRFLLIITRNLLIITRALSILISFRLIFIALYQTEISVRDTLGKLGFTETEKNKKGQTVLSLAQPNRLLSRF